MLLKGGQVLHRVGNIAGQRDGAAAALVDPISHPASCRPINVCHLMGGRAKEGKGVKGKGRGGVACVIVSGGVVAARRGHLLGAQPGIGLP